MGSKVRLNEEKAKNLFASLLNNTNFNTCSAKSYGDSTTISVFFVTSQPNKDAISPMNSDMKLSSCSTFLLVCTALLFTSCKRDVFDPDAYKDVIKETFPVGTIDPSHTWNLTQSHSIKVKADVDASINVTSVRILSGNPFEKTGVEILAETAAQRGGIYTLFFYAPAYQTTFYAALVADNGQHILKTFSSSDNEVTFNAGAQYGSGKMNALTYQTYTYCFEENYPEPGDWDFNDLVLRIQKLPSQQENTVRLSITLAAVGAKKQQAAAIRLVGYQAEDVESVTTEDGRTFDGGYSLKRIFIENSDLLMSGRNGEAILNLFEDAHYTLSPRLNSQDKGGGTIRMFYNTSLNPNGTTQAQIVPKTIVYVVKFRNPRLMDNFTLETLDVFSLEDFNSGKWEVHHFPYKAYQAINDYGTNETATSNNMAWALRIPSATFRYPIEGQSLGLYKDGVLTGAYMEQNHSYGQWVASHTSCLDWFLYPTTGLVY